MPTPKPNPKIGRLVGGKSSGGARVPRQDATSLAIKKRLDPKSETALRGSRPTGEGHIGTGVTAKSSRKPLLSLATQLGKRTNAVSSGAGAQRRGQHHQVKVSKDGTFYHVYGSGPSARRVKLSPEVAKRYGYTS